MFGFCKGVGYDMPGILESAERRKGRGGEKEEEDLHSLICMGEVGCDDSIGDAADDPDDGDEDDEAAR